MDADETGIVRERPFEAMMWQKNTTVHALWTKLEDLITMYTQLIMPLAD